jgi:alpha-1,3-rhamnosyl/mannosyltransferase
VHEGSVRILGYLGDGDLPWLYAAASLFLFPSIYEGFGLPVVEAMASGVPVAASDIPVLREIAGDSAQLVPPMEVARWSETIRALTEDASRRAALRDAGLRRAAQFTFDASAGRLLGLLERLARVGRS